MKKLLIYYVLIVAVCACYMPYIAPSTNAITYTLNASGRFGEHLTTYIKAKKLAKDYHLPFIYKPFAFADDLVMGSNDERYDEQMIKRRFKKTIHVTAEMILAEGVKRDTETLYVVQWGTALNGCRGILDIKDDDLMAEIKRLISLPNMPKKQPKVDENTITVALHVRKGGDYDPAWVLKQQPLRFPGDEYYLEQLKRIIAMFPGSKIEVHLFTDDAQPKKLAMLYTQLLKQPSVKFIYREFGNKHNANVLDDFFAIAECDCLVRPASCFSELAQIIGDHRVAVFPTSHKQPDKNNNKPINAVMVVTRDANNKKVFTPYAK